KRDGTVHVQTHHGTPLKKMGLDIRTSNPKAMNWRHFARRCRRWDIVISSNPYSSEIWRRAMPYDYRLIESGYPRNDVLFDEDHDRSCFLKERMGVTAGKNVALYAPTWREYGNGTQFNLPVSPSDLKHALGDEYVVLIRAHHLFRQQKDDWAPGILDISDYA